MWAGAAAAKPVLADYGRLPALEGLALSPAGDRFSYVAVTDDTRTVAVADADHKVLMTIGAGAAKVRDTEWAGDDHLMIYVTQTIPLTLGDRDLYEGFQAFSVNVKTRKYFDLMRKASLFPVMMGDYGEIQLDNHWYGFFGAITPKTDKSGSTIVHTYPDLYRIDLETGENTRIAPGGERIHHWVINGAGKVPAHSQFDYQSGKWRLYLGDRAGPEVAVKSAPIGGVGLLGFGRTPDTALSYDDTGDAERLEEWTLQAPGKATELFADQSVRNVLFDPVSKLLIGALVDNEVGAVLFDPKSQARLRGARRAFPKQQFKLVSYTPDFGRMIVFTEGADDSGTYWLVDIGTGKADPLGGAYPNVKPEDVAPASLVHYKAQDGLDIEAVLTLPVGRPAKGLPLVVLPHGGPESYDRLRFDWWAQAFANEGYAVLQPNFRGSDGRGIEFRRKGYGEWGRKMQTDVSDGVAFLASQGVVDSKRACIVGGSYGGYAALAGVTVQNGLYRCAASIAGVADPSEFQRWTAGGRGVKTVATRHWDAFMGTKNLDEISPTRLAARADAPILLIHGRSDTVVPLAQSEAMNQALRKAGKPVEFVVLDGEDHWLSQGKTRGQMLSAVVAFVEKYNPS
jgi:dipeptidyl aminopeptidase/acylaminoacyl peptidase